MLKKIVSMLSAAAIAFGCIAGAQSGVFGQEGTVTASAATTTADNTTYILPSERISGSNRYATAVECSKRAFPNGAKAVVLASAKSFADAFVGSSLAGSLKAPIILSSDKELPASSLQEIKRLKPERIYILGGTSVISDNIKTSLEKSGYKTTRVKGSNRYSTAVEIAKTQQAVTGSVPQQVIFVSGNGFVDALSVGPVAVAKNASMLYIDKSGVPDASVVEYLKANKGKISTAYVIGGEGSIGSTALTQLKKYIKTVQRIGGATRYETNLNIMKSFGNYFTGKDIVLTTGSNYPDALAGSMFANSIASPIMLVSNSVSANQLAYIKNRGTQKLYILGGAAAVSEAAVMSIFHFAEPQFTMLNFGTTVSLTWQESPKASAYELYRNGKLLKTFTNLKTTSYTDSGLNANQDYLYTIKFVYKTNGQKVYREYTESSGSYQAVLNSVVHSPRYTFTTENAQPTKSTFSSFNLQYSMSGKDIKTLENFAKNHFTKDMTNADKVAYTVNWINKNVWYGTPQNGGWDVIVALFRNGSSYVDCIFNHKIGQCNCYNGALTAMMLYLGYDAHLVMGHRGTANEKGTITAKWQHFWCEVKINGQTYVMEAGNYGEDGDWMHVCERYRNVDTKTHGYIKNGKIMMT